MFVPVIILYHEIVKEASITYPWCHKPIHGVIKNLSSGSLEEWDRLHSMIM